MKIVPYHELANGTKTSRVVDSWGVKVNSKAKIQVSKLADGSYAHCFRRRRAGGIMSELKFTLSPMAVVALLALYLKSGLADDAAATIAKRRKRREEG